MAEYYGETGQGFERRIKEYKSDVLYHRTTNSLVLHSDEHDHLPNWERAKTNHKGFEKGKRKKLVEAAY